VLYKPSYYNLLVKHRGWILLFNGVSSGLMRLSQEQANDLRPFLGEPRSRQAGTGLSGWKCAMFRQADLPAWVRQRFADFQQGQLFVPAERDEQQFLKDRYEQFRHNTPLVVTITTTMDCNLCCYYCYENKTGQYLTRAGCDAILAWIDDQNRDGQHADLIVDWYGGEPMLNQDVIDYFSSRAIQYCSEKGVRYESWMISNGTVWPEDAKAFVARNRIAWVQFTLDGPREHHNRRRRYVDRGARDGSYDTILQTIERLIGSLLIYVRVNVDPWIGRSALALIDVFDERGWLDERARFFPYLACIGPVTERCDFLRTAPKVARFQQEFDRLNHEFQLRLGRRMGPRAMRHLQYYPASKQLNCAAVGDHGAVFGPDGRMYKCCLDVGDETRAHGELSAAGQELPAARPLSLPITGSPTSDRAPDRWRTFDPFSDIRCRQCQYLPICLGGCPRVRMDGNEYYLAQQSQYWENNFARIIRTYFDVQNVRH